MADSKHLEILKKGGVDDWNAWRRDNPAIQPDLARADLGLKVLPDIDFKNTNLVGVSFNNARLLGADLSSSNIIGADFLNADFTGANFCYSSLTFVDFNYANLTGADLRQTDLRSAMIRNATLTDADFSGAIMGWTQFSNLDLSEVKGLELMLHSGPSSIGVDTIYRSKGKIPDEFLRRAGVPDDFITYIHSSGKGVIKSYYTCFISHSGKDKTFCDRLNKDLRTADVGTWYYEEDAKGGEDEWEQIEWAIKNSDKFLLVCSSQSLTSNPVLRELIRAIRREDEERTEILFPIMIDRYVLDEWEHPRKEDVRRYHVMDFTEWKDEDRFQDMLIKLLAALSSKSRSPDNNLPGL